MHFPINMAFCVLLIFGMIVVGESTEASCSFQSMPLDLPASMESSDSSPRNISVFIVAKEIRQFNDESWLKNEFETALKREGSGIDDVHVDQPHEFIVMDSKGAQLGVDIVDIEFLEFPVSIKVTWQVVEDYFEALQEEDDEGRSVNCGSLVPIFPEDCPRNGGLPRCHEVRIGELCEGDGECGTSPDLNNCGNYDVYRKQGASTSNVARLAVAAIKRAQNVTLLDGSCASLNIQDEL